MPVIRVGEVPRSNLGAPITEKPADRGVLDAWPLRASRRAAMVCVGCAFSAPNGKTRARAGSDNYCLCGRLLALTPGGSVVSVGIHMGDTPSFPYGDLWLRRLLHSVANLARLDGVAFLELAPRIPVKTTVGSYVLEDANDALEDLRHERFSGAAVIVPQ